MNRGRHQTQPANSQGSINVPENRFGRPERNRTASLMNAERIKIRVPLSGWTCREKTVQLRDDDEMHIMDRGVNANAGKAVFKGSRRQ